MVSIRNLEVKRILAEYQYKAISEIWKVYGQRAYPEQSELMWWPSGKGQAMHIDVMAKPLYEVPINARKGTPLEFMENEEDVINVVPFTDFASILYLNDNFEGGETEFLYQNRRELPKQGDVLLFPAGFTHTHRGNPPIGGEKYLITSWALIQDEE